MPRPRGTVRGFFDARRGRRVEVPLRGPNEDSGLQWLQLPTCESLEVPDLRQLWPCGRLVHPGTKVSEFDHWEDPIESTDR